MRPGFSPGDQEEDYEPEGSLFEFSRANAHSWLGIAIDTVAVLAVSIISGAIGYNMAWMGQKGVAALYADARTVLQVVELDFIPLTAALPLAFAVLCTAVAFGFALGQFRLRDLV